MAEAQPHTLYRIWRIWRKPRREIVKPFCFFFFMASGIADDGERYSLRAGTVSDDGVTPIWRPQLNDNGYSISSIPSTAAWLRGKEQERNSAGAILRFRRKKKKNSAISQTSETINLSANCSDRSIPYGSVFDNLLHVGKRERISVFREVGMLKTLRTLN